MNEWVYMIKQLFGDRYCLNFKQRLFAVTTLCSIRVCFYFCCLISVLGLIRAMMWNFFHLRMLVIGRRYYDC